MQHNCHHKMTQTSPIQLFEGARRPFRAESRDLPVDLAEREVLVQIELATICGSDLHTVSGAREGPTPGILGHEAVGRVVRKGPGREDLEVGRRITWSLIDRCGRCAFCTTYDLPQKCSRLFKYGHAGISDGSGLNGCYAGYIHLRGGTEIVPLPESLPDAVAAPANCALATMVEVVASLPASCESVLIQGAGMLGLYGCALLHTRGVKCVFCTDINPRRLSLVEAFGGVPVDGRAQQWPGERNRIVKAAPDGLDAVIEVAGVADLVQEGVALLRPGGYYGLVGLVHPRSLLNLTGEQIIRKCLTIRGTHNYHPRRLREAVQFLHQTQGQFPYESLVSPPFPLSQLADAVKAAQEQRWLRVSVVPDPPAAPQP
jgi:putative phosphonate catabolism associated alcohol dehydrogenase